MFQLNNQSVSNDGAVYSTGSDRPIKLAQVDTHTQTLTVRRKSHGTYQERVMHIADIARLLDPTGTTVRAV